MQGSNPQVVRCPKCGNTLGQVVGPIYKQTHKKRLLVGTAAMIVCEEDGGVWWDPSWTPEQREALQEFLTASMPARAAAPS